MEEKNLIIILGIAFTVAVIFVIILFVNTRRQTKKLECLVYYKDRFDFTKKIHTLVDNVQSEVDFKDFYLLINKDDPSFFKMWCHKFNIVFNQILHMHLHSEDSTIESCKERALSFLNYIHDYMSVEDIEILNEIMVKKENISVLKKVTNI